MKAVLLVLLGLCWPLAQGQPASADRNVQVMGPSVRTEAAVKGDFIAMGGRVSVDQPVAGDALLFGGTVDVRAPVGDDLRTAGGDVVLETSVGGDLMAAGGNLQLGPAARVAGRADLAGGEVRLDGQVDGALTVRARRLVLNGPVGGSVEAAVEQLELGPRARIGGGLRHSSATFTQDPSAVVSGPVERVDRLFEHGPGAGARRPMHEDGWTGRAGWWLLVPLSMGLLGVLALAAVVLFVFSRFAGQAAHQIEAAPWHALGLGAGLLVALPMLAILLIFTLLGIPLGLVVMTLYPPLLLLGWLIGALFAARWLASRASGGTASLAPVPFRWMALAVLVLLLLGAVPLLGPLLVTLTVAAGLGACVLEWRRRLGHPVGGAR